MAEADRQQAIAKYNAQCGLVTDLKNQSNDLAEKLTGSGKLMENWREKALHQTKLATQANEDYIEIAREKEKLEEALRRSKIEAKKIIKLKA